MGDLPPYASLDGTPPGQLYGLIARHAEAALTASYEFSWQRDGAFLVLIDKALQAAAKRTAAERATKPRWLDGLVARELRAMSSNYWSGDRFARVRLLERLGLVDLEIVIRDIVVEIDRMGINLKRALVRFDRVLMAAEVFQDFALVVVECPVIRRSSQPLAYHDERVVIATDE